MANLKFQNALQREPQDVPPIWFMRQAGRYHRHYQNIRAQHTFMEMCKDPQLAAQVALGPVQDFDFDVSILFSDLLFPLEAMGMGLTYDPAPRLGWHLDSENIKKLRRVDEALADLQFQKQAVIETRKVLPEDKSLIGFVGGPWTLFAYAVEGGHKGGLEGAKSKISLFSSFCEILTPLLVENIRLQLEGGAEVVMLFDTAAGELAPMVYRDLVVPQIEKLAKEYPRRLGYYAKGVTRDHLKHDLFYRSSLLAGLGLDHRWCLEEALGEFQFGFLQGNFDQSMLFLPESECLDMIEKYLLRFKEKSPDERRGWVSGLGHGVLPGTPENNVRNLIRMIREVMA